MFHSRDSPRLLVCDTGLYLEENDIGFITVAICGGYISKYLRLLSHTCISLLEFTMLTDVCAWKHSVHFHASIVYSFGPEHLCTFQFNLTYHSFVELCLCFVSITLEIKPPYDQHVSFVSSLHVAYFLLQFGSVHLHMGCDFIVFIYWRLRVKHKITGSPFPPLVNFHPLRISISTLYMNWILHLQNMANCSDYYIQIHRQSVDNWKQISSIHPGIFI